MLERISLLFSTAQDFPSVCVGGFARAKIISGLHKATNEHTRSNAAAEFYKDIFSYGIILKSLLKNCFDSLHYQQRVSEDKEIKYL